MKDNEPQSNNNQQPRRDNNKKPSSKQSAPAPLNDFQAKLMELKKKFN